MDKVQKFISENQHQFGYIMQEASRQWIKKNPSGALTVGTCNAFIEHYGSYHQILDKLERYEEVLKDIAKLSKYEGNQWYENLKKVLED
ncbi:hypothetical protein ICR95_20810 [Priestia megaterium]|uniref:Uncharacterized protein n=1 Tax=Priestia megaterium TaxID=1404 RepID=A0AAX6BDM0_PRIMG|nr:hypothetical protein ICR95_20810 [Priestia megaterium]GMG71799.1 hypothetical protein ShirakiTB12_02670 [Priestia megaterium]